MEYIPKAASIAWKVATNSDNERSGQSGNGRPRKNHFLIKTQKRNIIEDEGGEDIPFSAIKPLNEYKVFATNIRADTNLETIKRHIGSKLRANVTIIPLSKQGAKFI